MSASTQTSATCLKPQQFPGNCTMNTALQAIVDVYHRYSTREGNLDLLSFCDFKTLLQEQASTFLQACGRNNPDYMIQLFRETDLSNDKQLCFEEFSIVLAKLTNDAHLISHRQDRCRPEKD